MALRTLSFALLAACFESVAGYNSMAEGAGIEPQGVQANCSASKRYSAEETAKQKMVLRCKQALADEKPHRVYQYKAVFERGGYFSTCDVYEGLSQHGGQWLSFRGPLSIEGTMAVYKLSPGEFAYVIQAEPYETPQGSRSSVPLAKSENAYRQQSGEMPIEVSEVFTAHEDAEVYFGSTDRYGNTAIATAKPRPYLHVTLDFNFADGVGRRVNLSEKKVYDYRRGAVVGTEPCFESYTVTLK